MHQRGKFSAGGFTLVELMVVIAIVTILLVIALPTFSESRNRNRAASVSNDLITAFNVARNEAITRTLPVSVCPSSDGATCTGGGTATDWAKGWIAFVDQGAAGTVDAATDTVIRMWGPIASGNGDSISPDSTVKFIQFLPDGTAPALTAVSPSFVTFSIKPGNCRPNQQRSVVIGNYGRSTVSTVACS